MAVPDPDSLNERQLTAAAKLLAGVSPLVAELGALFGEAGYELALVGGPVRDVFLGRQSQDLDLTTDARPERIQEITSNWADQSWTIGIDFGTVGLRKGRQTFEITTYRADRYDRTTSRKPVVTYGDSLEGDLARRDFTVNAMAARLPGYRLVDPFGGLGDLRRGLLRTPGSPEESFSDDPLRILRAARFTAQLGLTAAPEVRAAMTELAGLLAPPRVSAERIESELTKLLLSPLPGGPVAGIALLVETGVADQIMPEVPALRLESDEHFRHKDVYQHSLTVLRQAIDLERRYGLEPDIVLRLAALLHDIGKPRTRSMLPGGRVGFHHHEVVGAKMARTRLAALRYRKEIVEDVSRLVELHLRFHGYGEGEWTDSAVRRYVTDAGPLLTRLHALTRADCTTRNKAKALRLAQAYDHLEARIAELATQEQLDSIRPDLNGDQIMAILGIPPGPLVGRAWAFLKELRMERGPVDHDTAVAELLGWAESEGLDVPPPQAENGDG
ncbi:MAG TPA: CCA tRNA nucleotidyltransferase [Streptosporangiaceae bacterium]|nr:CCA tRNA nucleotidyltransferase [Streptosporangiaceae bacterium]